MLLLLLDLEEVLLSPLPHSPMLASQHHTDREWHLSHEPRQPGSRHTVLAVARSNLEMIPKLLPISLFH